MKSALRSLCLRLLGLSLFCGCLCWTGGYYLAAADEPVDITRTRSGLQSLYDFSDASGPIIKDRAGVGRPVDLRIGNPKAVHRSEGSLAVRGSTLIQSLGPATKITDAVRRSGEITIEAWIKPTKTNQTGPARIVTLSRDGSQRNITLGQDKARYDVRLRTTDTTSNGIPSLPSAKESLTTDLTHVVYTHARSGRSRIYLNGKLSSETTIAGNTGNWAGAYRLAFANEFSKNRPWQGTYYLVAIYSRGLLPREVQQNFQAGANSQATAKVVKQVAGGTDLFHTQIAPLLAKHCLECHDSSSKEGGLDLSRKMLALAGGESGRAIVPGKSTESLLWEAIESDEMPEDRDPLSALEKGFVKQWIDSGASWTIDVIDPAEFKQDRPVGTNWVRRLTVPEYIETVRVAVGVDIAQEAREILPADVRADGFSNTAYNLNVDLAHVGAYSKLAQIIVSRMDVGAYAKRYTKKRLLTDDVLRGLIGDMGKWLLRGPLDDYEITSFRGISTTVASAGGNFDDAVGYIIEAMLQSPRFIYRIENQRGDGTPWPVSDYELASRLSYIIWGAPPDRELLKAADAGELFDLPALNTQIDRMLEDPRAIWQSSQFIAEWLNLARLDNMRPDKQRFPNWDSRLATDMQAETLAFFEDVAWKQNRPLGDLLNAQLTYATPRLAKHYGLEAKSDALSRYNLADVPARGGLLTQGSVLTIGGDDASMVTRGLFVLNDLLDSEVGNPPPGLDTTPIPSKPGLSQRQISERRIADKSCGGCHSKFEPLAFGLEKFDGLGVFHDEDKHGNQLRDDGEIHFPGAAEAVTYRNLAELMNLLAESERVRECITRKVVQFAIGRPLVSADMPVVKKIHASSQQGGGTYSSLIKAIVTSDLIQLTRTEPEPKQ